MDDGKRFLIMSLGGEFYALPISRLQEITIPRDIQKDDKLTEFFEGKFEYRGKWIPVVNMKRVFRIQEPVGSTLLIVKAAKGLMGLLVDTVSEIIDNVQKIAPVPFGVLNPTFLYYRGVLRHKESLVLLLNEDGFLP